MCLEYQKNASVNTQNTFKTNTNPIIQTTSGGDLSRSTATCYGIVNKSISPDIQQPKLLPVKPKHQ